MRSSHVLLCASLLVVGVVLFAGGLGSFAFVPPRGVHADDDGKTVAVAEVRRRVGRTE